MIAVVIIVAFWPLLIWYGQRMLDPSDPSWGLLALGALIYFLAQKPGGEARQMPLDFRWPIVGLTLYILSSPWAPSLLLSILAVAAVVSLVSQLRFGRSLHVGLLGLGLLALPVISSLQFYLGYPLRVLVAQCAVFLIQWNKLPVTAEGAGIKLGEKLVLVDAPCSGINMLWVALFLACLLSIIDNFGNKRTTVFLFTSVVCTIGANVIRAASLFYLETGIIQAPEQAHSFVGTATFGTLVVGLTLLSKWMAKDEENPHTIRSKILPGRGKSVFATLCIIAAFVPLLQLSSPATTTHDFPGWPTSFEGQELEQVPLSQDESEFYENFPGKAARFKAGKREVILRWVIQSTRSLHPSADCFRGLGYEIGTLELEDGWRVFQASKDGQILKVREQIVAPNGQTWSDVSSWYWSALLGRSEGPYWVLVVTERSDSV